MFGWPVYSVLDEVKPFDGDIEAGFYYINTTDFSRSRVQDGMTQIQFTMHVNVKLSKRTIYYNNIKQVLY